MQNSRQHRLFHKFPLDGSVSLSTGDAPIPYHVYDGNGLLISATGDFAMVAQKISSEDVHLVRTASGKAVIGIFVCDFVDASLEPHTELQVSTLVSRTKGEVVSDHPFALAAAMVTRPDWGTMCLHIWNDTEVVVAYNREYLGLNPLQGSGTIRRTPGRKSFEFSSPKGAAILSGDVSEKTRPRLRDLLGLMGLTGTRPLMRYVRKPFAEAAVLNMKNDVFPENRRAPTFTAADTNVLQIFEPTKDQLSVHSTDLAPYDIVPRSLQHISPFRFVYLKPDVP